MSMHAQESGDQSHINDGQRLPSVEARVEANLQHHDLQGALSQLNELKHSEASDAFKADRKRINEDIHKKGLLPGLDIVETNAGQLSTEKTGSHTQMPGDGGVHHRSHHGEHGAHHRRHHGHHGEHGAHHHGHHGDSGVQRHHQKDRQRHSGAGEDTAEPQSRDSSTQGEVLQNAAMVVRMAKERGIDPRAALGAMLSESDGHSATVSDGGHSIGIFQLNDHNGLGTGLSRAQRFDPEFNARVALDHMQQVQHKHPGLSPGQLAAKSEAPRSQESYAWSIDHGRRARQVAQILDHLKQLGDQST